MLRFPFTTKTWGFWTRPEKLFFCLSLLYMARLSAGVEPLDRIVIQPGEGGARFVLETCGTPFFVSGFNYIRLRGVEGNPYGDHATFDAKTETTEGYYDAERAEAMFVALRESGYNTVRVFIIGRSEVNPGIAGNFNSTGALYEPYMENVLDFLRRATRHGIRVLPTFGDGEIPMNAHYLERFGEHAMNRNVLILTEKGIQARMEYITSFLGYIKENAPYLLPTLLGVQFQNEAYLRADYWPFAEREGTFAGANGRTYDLSDTKDRQAMLDEGYRYYHDRMVAAVKAIDPGILVTEGLFVPRAVGKHPEEHAGLWPGVMQDERTPPKVSVIGVGNLDFLDIHFYRARREETVEEAFRRDLESTGFFEPQMKEVRKSRPIILGEFGAFDFVEETFGEAVDNMVLVRDLAHDHGFRGMLFWTYDTLEQLHLYHAASDWELFVGRLSNFKTRGEE